jgi:hypothetical protein
MIVTWRGSEAELARLEESVRQHCECVAAMLDLAPIVCAGHLMLADQSVLNHLLYVYRTRAVFISREFIDIPWRLKQAA